MNDSRCCAAGGLGKGYQWVTTSGRKNESRLKSLILMEARTGIEPMSTDLQVLKMQNLRRESPNSLLTEFLCNPKRSLSDQIFDFTGDFWWVVQDSNLRPIG